MLAAQVATIQAGPFDLQQWTQAPMQLEKIAELNWPVTSVFELLSNHKRWPRIFPWLKQVTVDNSNALIKNGLGAVRVCDMGNGMLLEEVIVGWQPPHMYAYAGLDETHPFGMRHHVSVLRFDDVVDGRAKLSWQHYFDHANPAAMREHLDNSLDAAMQSLIQYCGGELIATNVHSE